MISVGGLAVEYLVSIEGVRVESAGRVLIVAGIVGVRRCKTAIRRGMIEFLGDNR